MRTDGFLANKETPLSDLTEARDIAAGTSRITPEARHIRAYENCFDCLIRIYGNPRTLTFSLTESVKVEITLKGGRLTKDLLDRLIMYLQILSTDETEQR